MAFGKKAGTEIQVARINMEEVSFWIYGRSALVYNAMSQKNAEHLLMPPAPKSYGERHTTLKHEPYQEYRDSVYRRRDDEQGATRLLLPSRMFKAAMVDVITAVGGATKTDMKRLLRYDQMYVNIWGIPKIYLAIVRQAGATGAPDVRTRAIVEEWCCQFRVAFVVPNLNSTTVANILMNAGELNGVGDARQQKGAFDFGRFELRDEDDRDIKRLRKTAGMREQDKALKEPAAYDQETSALLAYFDEEHARRKLKPKVSRAASRRNGGGEDSGSDTHADA